MPEGTPSELALIKRPASLRQMVSELIQQPIVAVDTESNSLYAYQEQVCLIQFSIPQVDYLVDPLALDDLTPLAPLFADPEIVKVFHAAEYDLLCLKRDFGFRFTNLFDTMVAARILGRQAVGLGSMLENEFGVHVDKRYQRANWGQRPLPPYLMEYARLDTHYLIQLRMRLITELEQKQLGALAQEDFARLVLAPLSSNHTEDEKNGLCWRISGAHDLTPGQAAVLLELCRYREQQARWLNRPLFKVISDSTLLTIAQLQPQGLTELQKVTGMKDHHIQRYGAGLLEAIRTGQKSGPLYPPKPQRPNDALLGRLEALRRWRKLTGEKMGVSSDVVLPRDLMHALAEQNPANSDDLAKVMCHVPWRVEHFGSQILNLLNGKG
jgi:ribonuclease D